MNKRSYRNIFISILILVTLFLTFFLCACADFSFQETSQTYDNDVREVGLVDKIAYLFPAIKDELVIDAIPALGGDSFLVLNQGKAMLIDAGLDSSYPEINATLRSYRIDKIDVLIITHPHNDHIGGMLEIVRDYDIEHVYMIDYKHDSDNYYSLMDIIQEKNLDITYAKKGLTFDFADASCLVLNPQAEFLKDVNNNSLVFKMTYGEKTFLFTGDMEKKAEKKLLALPYDLKSDFIKIGHHGVDDASSKKFLAAVDPEFAVISSKKNHSYEKILNRLLDKGTKVYITLDGYHIKFTCKDNKIIVSSYESFTY
jgi:competence protein ComEC